MSLSRPHNLMRQAMPAAQLPMIRVELLVLGVGHLRSGNPKRPGDTHYVDGPLVKVALGTVYIPHLKLPCPYAHQLHTKGILAYLKSFHACCRQNRHEQFC